WSRLAGLRQLDQLWMTDVLTVGVASGTGGSQVALSWASMSMSIVRPSGRSSRNRRIAAPAVSPQSNESASLDSPLVNNGTYGLSVMAGQVAVQVGDTDTSRVIPCRPPTVTGAGDEVTRPG